MEPQVDDCSICRRDSNDGCMSDQQQVASPSVLSTRSTYNMWRTEEKQRFTKRRRKKQLSLTDWSKKQRGMVGKRIQKRLL